MEAEIRKGRKKKRGGEDSEGEEEGRASWRRRGGTSYGNEEMQ